MSGSMAIMQTIIYTISSGLLYPVMALLIILSVFLVVFAGGFLSEWIIRLRLKRNVDIADHLLAIERDKKLPEDVELHLSMNLRSYVRNLISIAENRDRFFKEKVESLIQKEEMKLAKEVDRIRLLVRIGPSLGLMGTLIPMGTGLAAMTQGDMAQMSSSLIIAFTTTVVGMAIGIVAYFFSAIKGRWLRQDVMDIELITEALTCPVKGLCNSNARETD